MTVSPIARITPSAMANGGPPSPNAAGIDPAIGTLATVATSMRTRTPRVPLDTALTDHVNCVHGIHTIRNSRTNSPNPTQSAWPTRWYTSRENANT